MKLIIPASILIFCLTFTSSFAQLKDNFEKGSFINSENEKLIGFIKTYDVTKYATGICFKVLEKDEKSVDYGISDIQAFSTESGKNYEKPTVKMNNNTDQITIFANLILKGKASLYKSVYMSKEFYIVKNNDNNYVLQKDEIVSYESQMRRYYYRGNLNMATEGYADKVKNIYFDEKDFIKVLKDYNTKNGFESQYLDYKEKKVNYFIFNIGGGNNNKATEYILQATYRTYFPKISQNTSMNIGINYFNNNLKGNINYSEVISDYNLTTIPLQIQQNFFKRKIRPYIFAGVNLSYTKFKNKNEYLNIDKGYLII
jgi:hypothetical protein